MGKEPDEFWKHANGIITCKVCTESFTCEESWDATTNSKLQSWFKDHWDGKHGGHGSSSYEEVSHNVQNDGRIIVRNESTMTQSAKSKEKERFLEHAEIKIICRYCGEKYAPNDITRFKRHLAGQDEEYGSKSGQCIKSYKEVIGQVRDAARAAIGNLSKRPRFSTQETKLEENKTISSSSILYSLSTSVPQYSMISGGKNDNIMQPQPKNLDAINKDLTTFILSHNLPVDSIENRHFARFVEGVSKFGHDYKLPSSSTLKERYVPEFGKEVEEYLKTAKELCKKRGCLIMIEKSFNFIKVALYYPKGPFLKGLYPISRFKTESDFEVFVSAIVEECGIHDVVQFITNDAQNFQSLQKLQSKYPKIFLISCVAQEIYSLLKAIYKEVGWVKSIIDCAKLIIEYLHEDDNICSLTTQYINGKKLKYPCPSRFASHYQMLLGMVDNKVGLQQLIASMEWIQLNFEKSKKREIMGIIENSNFWTEMDEVLNMMEPFIKVLCLVEDNRATSGYLYKAIEIAEETIEKLFSTDGTRYERSAVDFIIETLVDNEDKQTFIQEMLSDSSNTMEFTPTENTIRQVSHPCESWDYFKDRFRTLSKYAIQILSQTCKSTIGLEFDAFDISPTTIHEVRMAVNFAIMEKSKAMALANEFVKSIDIEKCKMPDYIHIKQGWEDVQFSFINEKRDDITIEGLDEEQGKTSASGMTMNANELLFRYPKIQATSKEEAMKNIIDFIESLREDDKVTSITTVLARINDHIRYLHAQEKDEDDLYDNPWALDAMESKIIANTPDMLQSNTSDL